MRRAFTLLELVAVAAVVLVVAGLAVTMVSRRLEQNSQRERLAGYVAELRAHRLAFVTRGARALRVVASAGGGAELRSITGTCAEDAANAPASTLVQLDRAVAPLTTGFCVDSYGRATNDAMTPTDVTLAFADVALVAHWDRTGAIFVDAPTEDTPVRPRITDAGRGTTADPTPGTQPITPQPPSGGMR